LPTSSYLKPDFGEMWNKTFYLYASLKIPTKNKIKKMIKETLIIVGPGGIGKSPLDKIIKNDVVRIDPYRLRKDGPRNACIKCDPGKEPDIFYAHSKLRDEIYMTFNKIGLSFIPISDSVQWCPNALTLMLKVRTEWQLLFLAGQQGEKAKAEIFAPVIPTLLSNPIIKNELGKVCMIILNPTDSLDNIVELKKMTKKNCMDRGDSKDSIDKRENSINEEIDAWKEMVKMGAKEILNWPFPESIYINNSKDNLIKAKQKLIEANNELESFFLTDIEISNLQ
jgi:hypothetical protein